MASLSEAEELYERYRKGKASAEDVRKSIRRVSVSGDADRKVP